MSKYIECLIKNKIGIGEIGQKIQIKKGYSRYLLSKNKIISIPKKSNTENIVEKQINKKYTIAEEAIKNTKIIEIKKQCYSNGHLIKKINIMQISKILKSKIPELMSISYNIKIEGIKNIEQIGEYILQINTHNDKNKYNIKILVSEHKHS